MSSSDLIAVTGATGQLGGRIADRLGNAGLKPRLVVRSPSRAPAGFPVATASYSDGFQQAVSGVSTLLLVSATESADRVAQHTAAVDAAVAAGVSHVVYISFIAAGPDATFTFARDHWRTEEHIRASGLGFTFLRDNLYLDLLPYFAGEDGVIRGPAGDGRVSAVARDDIADVATAVLLDPGTHAGQTYSLTGPEALTLASVAETLTRSTGREIRYHAETLEEAYASRAHYGAPEWEVAGWVTSYTAIAAGELAPVTDDVERVAGHRPMSLAELLAR